MRTHLTLDLNTRYVPHHALARARYLILKQVKGFVSKMFTTNTHNYVNFQLKKSDKVEGDGENDDGDYQKLCHPWPLKFWKIFC